MSPLVTLLVLLAVGFLVAGLVVWVQSYRSRGSVQDATVQATRWKLGVITGAIMTVALIVAEFAMLFGTVGDIVAMFPGAATQLVLALIAVLGFSGYLELGIVGGTILVVAVLAIGSMFRSRGVA